MQLGRVLAMLAILASAPQALAQEPSPPAPEPAPPPAPEPTPPAPEPTPPPESATPPETAAAPAEAAPPVDAAPPVEVTPAGPAPEIAPKPSDQAKPAEPPRSERARWPLTLEGKLGFSVRPESSGGYDDETQLGTDVGGSLYLEIKREFAAGLEIDRVSLGRGTAISGRDSITADYSVTSAMLGFRAYPWRSEILDLFVGIQLGVGIQGVSAAGTVSQEPLAPAVAYACSGSDAPGFQIGGGVGARLMLSSRWGVTARVSGTGRRLTSEVVEDCARGLGTATTIGGSLAVGYDFELEP